jgi:hypothetical protein
MARLSQEDRDYIIREVESEIETISQDEYDSRRRTRSSFMQWIRDIAYKLGQFISAPFRAVGNFIEGLLEGLFG